MRANPISVWDRTGTVSVQEVAENPDGSELVGANGTAGRINHIGEARRAEQDDVQEKRDRSSSYAGHCMTDSESPHGLSRSVPDARRVETDLTDPNGSGLSQLATAIAVSAFLVQRPWLLAWISKDQPENIAGLQRCTQLWAIM